MVGRHHPPMDAETRPSYDAHVGKEDIGHDVVGTGAHQSRPQQLLVSKGLFRSKVPEEGAYAGGTSEPGEASYTLTTSETGDTTAAASHLHVVTSDMSEGATALAVQEVVEAEAALDVAPKAESAAKAATSSDLTAQIARARMTGYEGEACPECANFTLVRNGTCLKCDTCGSTTGCS